MGAMKNIIIPGKYVESDGIAHVEEEVEKWAEYDYRVSPALAEGKNVRDRGCKEGC